MPASVRVSKPSTVVYVRVVCVTLFVYASVTLESNVNNE